MSSVVNSAEQGLLKGETLGIDATTLEANAALRSIVRRDTGEGYQEFLQRLAKESGMATPTREQPQRFNLILMGGFRVSGALVLNQCQPTPRWLDFPQSISV